MDELAGRIKRITYYDNETHFIIARLTPEKSSEEEVSVLGHLANPVIGESLIFIGDWERHPRFGAQFRFHSCRKYKDAGLETLTAFLLSGLVKGLSRRLPPRIIETFGHDLSRIIEKEHHRLQEIAGIGKDTAEKIHKAWTEHIALRDLAEKFEKAGLPHRTCARIFRLYGNKAEDVISQDPFQLLADFPKEGIKILNSLVSAQIIEMGPRESAALFIFHMVKRATLAGDTFVPHESFLKELVEGFGINRTDAEAATDELAGEGVIILDRTSQDEMAVFDPAVYEAERGIARKIGMLLASGFACNPLPEDQTEEIIAQRLAVKLSSEQAGILKKIMQEKVAVLTGGPGTGKTTLVRTLAVIFERSGIRYMLAAPTGRAARRISEITGRPASTIHRLLGYNPGEDRFTYNETNPLETDAIIIDEASMVDVLLMERLLRALPVMARLILVGDFFQLPPVGPGNLLADLIESGRVPVHSLNQIFRQKENSPIYGFAHEIRKGNRPPVAFSKKIDKKDELILIEEPDPKKAVLQVIKLCTKSIPEIFGLDPLLDIQVISPMHRREAGTVNLNRLLQEAINPGAPKTGKSAFGFAEGDKVIQLSNNYDKDVFNGDIGRVKEVKKKEFSLVVDFYNRPVEYDLSELDQLSLGYAITVHKSQGSEYPAIVIPILDQHRIMLDRNLLYTAITRGKRIAVIIGSTRAISVALANRRRGQRLTDLAGLIRHHCPAGEQAT